MSMTVTLKVWRQASPTAQGRLETGNEADILADLDDRFATQGYRFRRLLLELVTHEGFRTLAPADEGGQ